MEAGGSRSSGRDRSVKRYAKDVFHECLVTGVPNIVSTPSLKSKIFKMCVLGLCFCGFLYQAGEFISVVLTYPSVVDIHVQTPKEFIFPALTMCNINGIRRSKFCEVYPERCETPENETEFCSLYPHYCDRFLDWKNFKVPKRQFYDFESNATLREMKDLGHENQTFVEIGQEEESPTNIEGPHVFFKNYRTAFTCYSIHSRADSPLDPDILHFYPLAGIHILNLTFNFEPSETFLPGREPGGLLSIHSPFELVNPYDNGIFLKPAKIYKIHLKLQQEELLPFPYKSSCDNYTQKWLDNGRTGPRSQEMCKQACLSNVIVKSCNCTHKFFTIPHDEDTCFTEDITDCMSDEAEDEADRCVDDKCKDDCQKYKFLYEIQERPLRDIDWSGSLQEKQMSSVFVYASDPEVVVYKYRPHYQNIEVFSYIGGYIGAWLGISLVAIADFFECLFRVTSFAIRRRKGEKKNERVSPESKL